MQNNFSEQVAVVTGGSRGIGRVIAQTLAQAGASVVINYTKNAAVAEELAQSLLPLGVRAEAFCFNVAEPEAVENSFKHIVERFGRLDILVNNAGIASDGLLLRTKTQDWQSTIDVNLSGCFYCAKAAARPMVKARYGRIINVSSVIGEMGNAGQVAYAASKSGIFGLTKSLARELGSRAITVNAVTPGYITTDMTAEMPEEQTQAILAQTALGRLGEPQDVANLVAFLASRGAGYITGQVIGVNGGMYM